jgi:hypothetical protein
MSGYKKHFLPLESNPDVFTELIHRLGAVQDAAFEDVLALDEPEFFPHPALALVLVLPTTPAYEERKAAAEAARHEYNDHDKDAVMWFKQRINNACGLYAVIHALFNSDPYRLFGERRLCSRLGYISALGWACHLPLTHVQKTTASGRISSMIAKPTDPGTEP